MASDIHECYGSLLNFKDYYPITKLFHEFWRNKYPDIANLMKLINLIGWFYSALDQPVQYSILYFTTVQDYMCNNQAYIWVYDRVCKKRHRITLLVPMSDRDKRKADIHTNQRDELISH